MLKGHHTTLVTSIIIHILLLLVLVFLSGKQQQQTKEITKKPSIKSYLYRPVKPIPKIEPKKTTIEAIKKAQLKKVEIQEETEPKKVLEKTAKAIKKTPEEKTLPPKTNEAPQKEIALKKPTAPALPSSLPVRPAIRSSSLSSHQSLSRLRNSINQQLANDFSSEQTQVRSASKMHGEQLPVPHSEVALTAEEKHHKNTRRTHANAITKNDDGTCTIVREQILGSPVEASVSGFACGESKFDKSFREHMKAVNKKFVLNKK